MPARGLPVESRSRRRPSGAGFRRTATQMALSRCAIAIGARTGASGAARQPSPAWRRSLRAAGTCPRPDRPPAGRAQRLRPNGCIDIRLHPVTTTAIRHAQVPAVRYFASGRLWSHSSRIAGCSAFRIAAVGTLGGEQMRADGCLRLRVTGDAEFARPGNRLRGLLQAGYELVAFHCQLLIIAVRVGASDVWSLGIVRNIIKYSMPLRTVIHSA